MTGKHILIVGTGSVGKRHASNLHGLGCSISAVDPRPDRCAELGRDLPLRGQYRSVEEALAAGPFDGAVIGSPPAFHVDQSILCLQAGIPVLLEKPVSPDLASARRLRDVASQPGSPALLLGYTWRWWPAFDEVWCQLRAGRLGALRHVRFIMSAHLADWHPWERYQDFFMAHSALGGGALLDESHWIDLMLWFFGMPESVFARIEHLSDLEISSDDNVDLLFNYAGGLRVAMHLDLYGRPHEKSIRFIGENGSMLWTDSPNRVSISQSAAPEWENVDFTAQRNDMFLAVAREFLRLLDGQGVASCGIEDGLRVLQLIEAARLSHAGGRLVALTEVMG